MNYPTNIIDQYTREDAINDGVLIDVSETAREAGFKLPVAMTVAAHGKYVTCDEIEREQLHQDPEGRLWDILKMLAYAAKRSQGNRIIFRVIIAKPDRGDWEPRFEKIVQGDRTMRLVTLAANCHGGDNGEPVITILKPNED